MERKKMAMIFRMVNLWLCQMMYLVGGGTLIENQENYYNVIAILGFVLIQLARHPHLMDLSGLRNHMKEASGLVGFSSLWKIGAVHRSQFILTHGYVWWWQWSDVLVLVLLILVWTFNIHPLGLSLQSFIADGDVEWRWCCCSTVGMLLMLLLYDIDVDIPLWSFTDDVVAAWYLCIDCLPVGIGACLLSDGDVVWYLCTNLIPTP